MRWDGEHLVSGLALRAVFACDSLLNDPIAIAGPPPSIRWEHKKATMLGLLITLQHALLRSQAATTKLGC